MYHSKPVQYEEPSPTVYHRYTSSPAASGARMPCSHALHSPARTSYFERPHGQDAPTPRLWEWETTGSPWCFCGQLSQAPTSALPSWPSVSLVLRWDTLLWSATAVDYRSRLFRGDQQPASFPTRARGQFQGRQYDNQAFRRNPPPAAAAAGQDQCSVEAHGQQGARSRCPVKPRPAKPAIPAAWMHSSLTLG